MACWCFVLVFFHLYVFLLKRSHGNICLNISSTSSFYPFFLNGDTMNFEQNVGSQKHSWRSRSTTFHLVLCCASNRCVTWEAKHWWDVEQFDSTSCLSRSVKLFIETFSSINSQLRSNCFFFLCVLCLKKWSKHRRWSGLYLTKVHKIDPSLKNKDELRIHTYTVVFFAQVLSMRLHS